MSADRDKRPRLTRETLRELQPADDVAAAVRGGDHTSFCPGERCNVTAENLFSLLPKTHMSWGCQGTISIRTHDEGLDITYDLHPNEELLRALNKRGRDPLG
jgi:hypothetical protein